jgi:tetratricopeptide (TPR) repeat protein
MGRHEEALADYMRALELDPELADGPHWLTRFLRNQPEAPPTIADRAAYLRAELAKPEAERVLRIPELDAQQRPYQQ